METLKAFFTQLFTELSTEDSLAVIFFLFVSFLIGLLFGWLIGRRKVRRLRKDLKQKESEVIALKAEHAALQEQFELKAADLKKLELENLDLKNRIALLEEDKVQAQGNLYAVNDELEKLKAEHKTSLLQIENLETIVVGLEEATTAAQPVAGTTEPVNNDLVMEFEGIQADYNATIERLAAIEAKLNHLEGENAGLRTEVSSLKNSPPVVTVIDTDAEDEEIEVIESPEAKAMLARQSINAAFGKRLTLATAADKDDLKQINGIGPFIENKLNEIGIYTFEQISQLDEELISQVTDAIQFFPGRILRDDWVGQAKSLKGNG